MELLTRTLRPKMSQGNHHERIPSAAPITCFRTVRKREPPYLNGTDDHDFEDWLTTYERVSTYNNWDDKMKHSSVSVSLTGVAEVWYRNHGSEYP